MYNTHRPLERAKEKGKESKGKESVVPGIIYPPVDW